MRIGPSAPQSTAAIQRPAAPPARPEAKELKPTDGFASSQLPAGVGENLNIKA
jgi:hypothetical protein